MDAAILCGGLGTRLASAWSGPKCLAPVLGKPFLTILLDQLGEAKFERVVLCVGHGADEVETQIGTSPYKGMELVYSREHTQLGTGGGLALAAKKLRGDRFLVMNGDSYVHYPLGMFSDSWSTEASMLAVYQPNTNGKHSVEFKDDLIHEYKRFDAGNHRPGWASAGVYVLSRSCLPVSTPRDGKPWSLEDVLIPRIVARKQMNGLGVRRPFIDIGTPESYEQADSFFQQLRAER